MAMKNAKEQIAKDKMTQLLTWTFSDNGFVTRTVMAKVEKGRVVETEEKRPSKQEEQIAKAIREKRVMVGMTFEQVKTMFKEHGEPKEITENPAGPQKFRWSIPHTAVRTSSMGTMYVTTIGNDNVDVDFKDGKVVYFYDARN